MTYEHPFYISALSKKTSNLKSWLKDTWLDRSLLPTLEFNLYKSSTERDVAVTAADEIATQPTAPSHSRFLNVLLKLNALKSFSHNEFCLLWYGQVFVSLGQWMDEVTRGWLIYELTHSAVQLGLVKGIQAVPFLLLSPVAGSAADRYSRKWQMMVSQVVNGGVYIATALLIFTGRIRPWHVYVTAFLMASVQVFQQPARAAMIADAVPPDTLINAIGLNATLNNIARSIGPALAGMLIAAAGTGGTYCIQAVFYFLATYWTFKLRSSLRSPGSAGGHAFEGKSFVQSIIEGWRFSWRNEAVRTGLLAVMLVSLFMAPFLALLPLFAKDILGVGSTGQGLLLTAMGVGAMCSALLIASAGDRLPRGMFMLGSVVLYGFIVIFFAASPWFKLSVALMAIVGLCHVHSHALVQTVIQTYSPSQFRGRVIAIFHMSKVVTVTGSVLVGALSSYLGAPWAVALLGAVGTVAMIAVWVLQPQARQIR